MEAVAKPVVVVGVDGAAELAETRAPVRRMEAAGAGADAGAAAGKQVAAPLSLDPL